MDIPSRPTSSEVARAPSRTVRSCRALGVLPAIFGRETGSADGSSAATDFRFVTTASEGAAIAEACCCELETTAFAPIPIAGVFILRVHRAGRRCSCGEGRMIASSVVATMDARISTFSAARPCPPGGYRRQQISGDSCNVAPKRRARGPVAIAVRRSLTRDPVPRNLAPPAQRRSGAPAPGRQSRQGC